MARKLFLSFLGTNKYKECIYSHGNYKSSVVCFVQSAITEMCCRNWTENDAVIIFTTQEALSNWELLRKEWTLKIPFKNVMIPSGENENQIWNIFQIIYDTMQDNDEMVFDITHSFRSIPLIASSLLQYAKSLKNIKVNQIYYGAFETLGSSYNIDERYPNPEDRIAPIFDLTAFSDIQDWSIAANDFIKYGNSKRLNEITHKHISPILKETKGKDNVAVQLRLINDKIKELSLDIKTNRGHKLIEGQVPEVIKNTFNSLKGQVIAPIKPILEELQISIDDIYKKTNDRENMLSAVQWCIDKELIQEGFTLLQEGIISYFLEDYKNKSNRNFVSAFLSHKCKNNFNPDVIKDLSDKEKDLLQEMLNSVPRIDEWSRIFAQITESRNDINHAGMNENARPAKRFETDLENYYCKVQELIQPC